MDHVPPRDKTVSEKTHHDFKRILNGKSTRRVRATARGGGGLYVVPSPGEEGGTFLKGMKKHRFA